MRNRYPGTCIICGAKVTAGDGHFERASRDARRRFPKTYSRLAGDWALRCRACIGVGHPADEEPADA